MSETQKIADWIFRRGYATGHGDTVDDLLHAIEGQAWERGLRDGQIFAMEQRLGEAIGDVFRERERQKKVEGWTDEHDDINHRHGELARAAGCYAIRAAYGAAAGGRYRPEWTEQPPEWPWEPKWWKPKTPRRDLVRAAALIVAEIERIDRTDRKREGR